MSPTEPLRIVSLESRNAAEMARLLERHGLLAISAPSMREVPLDDQREAVACGEAMLRGECDLLVLLTGVGARALFSALEARFGVDGVAEALARVPIACRGPKPAAVLKERGLRPIVVAPEPNTLHELAPALEPLGLQGKRVWVQEYGKPQRELTAFLQARGAEVHSAAVYAWRLPEDTGPLRSAIALLCDDRVDGLSFTSAQQLEHVLLVAEEMHLRDALLAALRSRVLVCSIGPTTSEALRHAGIEPDIEPAHPKMGHLVKAIAELGTVRLAEKRARK